MQTFSLTLHGGAGAIRTEDMPDELQAAYTQALQQALDAGYTILANGGTAIAAVKATILCLEDNILFNAGRGAVFTKKGLHELDAAIMNGKTLEAGAVAGVRNVRNPIELAERVMLHSGHVLLSGNGAIDFAIQQGIPLESDHYFFSQYRYDQWVAIRDSEFYQLDHKADTLMGKDKKLGTVGAVACDMQGNIAAGTSTGGMTNKKYGRIGDSPIIGCGTYANNNTCAISCTGHGEIFIRTVAAYDVSCLMEYKGFTLQQAMEEVVHHTLIKMGGEGGMIGADATGNTAWVFNTAGMYRARRNSKGLCEVKMFA
jgi:beta-aspartyl-peptidase (threonine type)